MFGPSVTKGRATKWAVVFMAMVTAISNAGSEWPDLSGLLEKLEIQIFGRRFLS